MSIEISAAGGTPDYEYYNASDRDNLFIKPFSEDNEIYLIMSDESRVPMLVSSANGSYNGEDFAASL